MKDLSVTIANVHDLAEEVKKLQGFNLEDAKENGMTRFGSEAIYLSNSLRDYIFNKNVSPDTEGTLITLYYQTPEDDISELIDLSYLSYVILRQGLKENEVGHFIEQYLEATGDHRKGKVPHTP